MPTRSIRANGPKMFVEKLRRRERQQYWIQHSRRQVSVWAVPARAQSMDQGRELQTSPTASSATNYRICRPETESPRETYSTDTEIKRQFWTAFRAEQGQVNCRWTLHRLHKDS